MDGWGTGDGEVIVIVFMLVGLARIGCAGIGWAGIRRDEIEWDGMLGSNNNEHANQNERKYIHDDLDFPQLAEIPTDLLSMLLDLLWDLRWSSIRIDMTDYFKQPYRQRGVL